MRGAQGDARRRAVGRAVDEAEEATAAGRVAQAVDAYRRGAEVVRGLLAEEPYDDDHRQQLGSMLYSMASLLVAEAPAEAVTALDEAEQAYGGMVGHRRGAAPGQVADVQARRARAHLATGAFASALVDADSATVARIVLADGGEEGPDALERSRVLAWQAEVATRAGDPDVGVAAADAAVRTYLRNASAVNMSPGLAAVHQPTFARAAHVAATVHAAFGRHDVARAARDLATRVDPVGVVRRTLVIGTEEEVAARVTLADALGRVGAVGLRARLTAPALDVAIVTTSQRAASTQVAHAGVELARLAVDVLGTDPAAGMRVGLEAHVLLAGASRRGEDAMVHGMAGVGPPWAEVLRTCSQRAWADGDGALATDLAGWMTGVCDQLIPAAMFDPAARATSVACTTWSRDLATATGDTAGAASATEALTLLTSLPAP